MRQNNLPSFKEEDDWQGFKIYKGKKEFDAIFTNSRIDPGTVPAGLYMYQIRGGDSEDFCTIEPYVAVNHTGTIFTKCALPLGRNGYINLESQSNDYSFDDECLDAFEEYIDL